MKASILLCSIIIFFQLQSCNSIRGWQSYAVKEQNGRVYLKNMELKNKFKSSMNKFICVNCIYYHQRKNESIDREFNFIIRFFENGQYAYFIRSESPIQNLTFYDINFNDLSSAKFIGYYTIKDNIITLEYPNFLFRRAGKRSLDKYRILLNGDIKSITKQASDYGALYQKIKYEDLKVIAPDW